MQEEQEKNVNVDAADPSAAAEAKREVSTISFPYGDLDDAVSFAKAVHEVGGHSCLTEQLAGHLKVSAAGGSFRARMAHPRIFGLVEYDKGTIRLTPLGMRIVDAKQEQASRVEAFLTVPLYKAIYEKYKGYTLPPPAALEREMAGLGVSSKQTDKARQAFDRSAKQAGFFWAGNDRLTLPVNKSTPDSKPIDVTPEKKREEHHDGGKHNGGNGGGSGSGYHPFIEGLLKTLPTTGETWPHKDRAKWLTLAANAFDMIYEDGGDEVAVVVTTTKSNS